MHFHIDAPTRVKVNAVCLEFRQVFRAVLTSRTPSVSFGVSGGKVSRKVGSNEKKHSDLPQISRQPCKTFRRPGQLELVSIAKALNLRGIRSPRGARRLY